MRKLACMLLCLLMLLSTVSGTAFAAQTFTAGTYTSVAQGNNGDVKVSVTFSEDALTAITVDEHSESAGIADPALERIPNEILAAQSVDVDTVTGATNTSNAILAAVTDCIVQAGGDPATMTPVASNDEADAVLEVAADVVIIGAGGAGMAAAVSAAQSGASVIVLEENAAIGGSTLASGMGWNAADPVMDQETETLSGQVKTLEGYLEKDESQYGKFAPNLKALKEEIKEYLAGDTTHMFDSVNLHIVQCFEGGSRTDLNGNYIEPDYDLITMLCENSLDTYHWVLDLGAEGKTTQSQAVGALWYRTHAFVSKPQVFETLKNTFEGLNGTLLMETKADKLLTDDTGRVIGVHAVQANGVEVVACAEKGVIMATGGFCSNEEMVREYNTYWPAIPEGIKSTNIAAAQGDGILMGQEVGAQLVGMGFIQLQGTRNAVTGGVDGFAGGVANQNIVIFNQEGKRFVSEYAERDVIASAILAQTGGIAYKLQSNAMAQYWYDNNYTTPEAIEKNLQDGIVFRFDTLEEIAEYLQCDPETLKAEVDSYNGYVDDGVDPVTGRNVFGLKLDNAPYYLTPLRPALHHTMGGLKINTQTQVLNQEDAVIPGLYAAGEVTGGIHAGNRLGGNAVADVFVFGRIAGATVAAQ